MTAVLQRFGPATRAWFETAFAAPTEVQVRGWERIASGEHALLIAPTGSGKTLAAFLWCIDRLVHGPPPSPSPHGPLPPSTSPASNPVAGASGTRVLYVSPLKALVYDVERNLRVPLIGISRAAERLGLTIRVPSVSVRTGDTSSKERRLQARAPADILITTPESLYLILGSQARAMLSAVDTVIIDEAHALAPTKRGAHLSLSLERLAHSIGRDPQRIALSATAAPLDEVARFVGGDRPVAVIDTAAPPRLDLEIVVPVADMTRPEDSIPQPGLALEPSQSLLMPPPSTERGMWPAIYPRLLDLVRGHRTTIIFVNSRGLCERLTHQLNELAGTELVRSHHGSLAHSERAQVEELLKSGQIAGIVATSSLELGIDMGAVDLVVLVESPASVASGLQRIGRAGHSVGEVSKGRLFPKHRGDLLEAAVVAERMARGAIEPLRVPQNPLDVLAQHVVAMVSVEPWTVAEMRSLVRRSGCFRGLPEDAFTGVLDMLAGRYPSTEFAELTPRIVWDRQADLLSARRGARLVAVVNGGTIPDRGTYGVYLGEDGPRLGELDEEMVHETTPGQTFTLGASTWRVEQITRDRVLVSPAPGESGKLPFWRGDGPGRPIELGRAIGTFIREITSMEPEAAAAVLCQRHFLDPLAASNLLAYLDEQREATGVVPSDRTIVIERFRDELGDYRVCILSPFGARVHAPWALALQARLSARAGFAVQALWSDDGIVLRMADADEQASEQTSADVLVPEPEEIEDLVVAELASSALFAGQFRENAARALLLPRRRPGQRTPLWVQRLKSQSLLAVARSYPSFPVIMETYRSCLQDVFDLPALAQLLGEVRSRKVRVKVVDTSGPSPFARSLVFAYVAAYLYEGDAPLAERKAQALALDRRLLRELLGQEELRELLDAEVMDGVEAELQGLDEHRRVRHADDLHDLLRRIGDLTVDEIRVRTSAAAHGDGLDASDMAQEGIAEHRVHEMLEELARTRRAVRMRIGVQDRWVAVEDVALYRDALGAVPPPGVAEVFLQPYPEPVDALLRRYARTHGPFTTGQVAARYGLPPAQVDALLAGLEARGLLVAGAFRPGGVGPGHEWCDPDVLRRIKRRTLARLREQVAPVEASALGRFLPAWHGIGHAAESRMGLQEALAQLEGLPLSYGELEQVILPSRVPGFSPRMLDELGAMGWLVWVGCGSLGGRDGKVALYRRDHVAGLLAPSVAPGTPAGMPGGMDAKEPQTAGVAAAMRMGAEELLEAADIPGGVSALHRAIYDHLGQRGASFFVALQSACMAVAPQASTEEIIDALWDLVWAGLVTNDTFQPLRALGRSGSAASERGSRLAGRGAGSSRGMGMGPGVRSTGDRLDIGRTASGRSGLTSGLVSGRWSRVSELLAMAPSPTERAHQRALKLLERHGVVSREVVDIEALPGGFSAVYGVLKAMEEAGRVRRGYFVEGLGGAQFAFPGAIDRLRGVREVSEDRTVVVLSAVDPANPYGWLLPWPEHGAAGPRSGSAASNGADSGPENSRDSSKSGGPRRVAGATVVLVGGEAVLYLDKGGKRLLTFRAATGEEHERLALAASALGTVASRRRGKYLRIDTIDGEPARSSRHREAFRAAGFFADHRGLVLEAGAVPPQKPAAQPARGASDEPAHGPGSKLRPRHR